MGKFRSNLNSINNNALQFARHNDAHSNDALETLLTNIYTAAPEAVIIETGVNYRTATTDFQAWAIYYNPMQIFNPAAPNKLELISQLEEFNYYAYTGTFEIFDQADLGAGVVPAGNYFCLTSVDYQSVSVYDVLIEPVPVQKLGDIIQQITESNFARTGVASITIVYEVAGGFYITTFDDQSGGGTQIGSYQPLPVDNFIMAADGAVVITGDPIPAHGTTGRFGILLNQYTI